MFPFYMHWTGENKNDISVCYSCFFFLIEWSIIKVIISKKTQNSTTIVTAFFVFSKSKHGVNEYEQWLENLLSYTENPMVIFTSNQTFPLVKRLRNARSSNGNYFPTMIITDFDTPWEMPPIKQIKDVLISQWNMDSEKGIHSPDLYAIWNAKAWMLEYAALQNPFKTSYFLWVDAGAFRNTHYRLGSWPNQTKTGQIFKKDGLQRLLLGLMARLPQELCAQSHNGSPRYNIEHGPIARDLIQGTVFGGSLESIRWWSELYYATIHSYIRKNWFVGKDQITMNALAFAHPERIQVILTFKLRCGDPWFAFAPLLADDQVISNNFGNECLSSNLSSLIIPMTDVCLD
jgi:hypothetical protein